MDPEETAQSAPEASAAPATDASLAAADHGSQGTTASQAEAESPYASDPAVQKHISDRISSALKHIPKEYRDEAKFRELMQARDYLSRLAQDPRFQAYRQALEGGAQERKQAVHERIAQALAEKYQLQDGGKFVGALAEQIMGAMRDEVLPQHTRPLEEQIGAQTVERELAETRARYPDFDAHQEAIKEVVDRYKGTISFDDAYRIATHGKTAERQADKGDEEAATIEERKRAARTEKPTGHGAGEIQQSRPKNRKEAMDMARRALRAKGLLT